MSTFLNVAAVAPSAWFKAKVECISQGRDFDRLTPEMVRLYVTRESANPEFADTLEMAKHYGDTAYNGYVLRNARGEIVYVKASNDGRVRA